MVYISRLLLFVFSIFHLKDQPIYQILLLNYTNLICLLYQAITRPLHFSKDNNIQSFNELIVSFTCLHAMFYTDWVTDPQIKNLFGWSQIFHMLLLAAVNLSLTIFYMIKEFIMVFKKVKNMILMRIYKNRRVKIGPKS